MPFAVKAIVESSSDSFGAELAAVLFCNGEGKLKKLGSWMLRDENASDAPTTERRRSGDDFIVAMNVNRCGCVGALRLRWFVCV